MNGRDWPWATLDEVATVTAGNPAPQGAEFFEGGSRPFVRVQDLGRLNGASHLTETADRVNECAAANLKLFPKGSVLFTKSGASLLLNQRAVLGRDMHVVSHIGVAVPGPRIMSEWLYYWLRTLDFAAIAHGANMPSLPLARVKQLRVPVPPVPEQQRRVAEIEKQFSRLDEAVANLKRVKANLKRYKSAFLKAAVEGRLVPTEAELASREGRSYEPGIRLLARVLQERRRAWNGRSSYQDPAQPDARILPPLPEGWAWARLDAVAALKGGITVDKGRRDPTARPVPYLRVANVQRGYLDLEEVKEIDAPQADIEELRLQHGDILFNEGGDRDKLGRGWIWESQLTECIHQNHVFRARPYSEDVSGKLVSWWGNTFGKDYFLREGKQTTNLASINMTKLSAFPVPIPPLKEQHRIVAEVDRRLSLVREVEVEVDTNLQRTHALRLTVLNRAFTTFLPFN